jgi:hypothetical protein
MKSLFDAQASSRKILISVLATAVVAPALAASFGSQQIVGNVRVSSIFKGSYGPIYITFAPSALAGCNGDYGGYLTSTWGEASAGSPADQEAAKMQLALLMTAKATDAVVEVRYRVNVTGTGWDKCAIDAIWVQ